MLVGQTTHAWPLQIVRLGASYRIHNTPFSSLLTNRPYKLDCSITQLERRTSNKYFNLLGQFLSYKENEAL
jgi:hypothetical protein